MGPLISKQHLDKVSYVEKGISEGANLILDEEA